MKTLSLNQGSQGWPSAWHTPPGSEKPQVACGADERAVKICTFVFLLGVFSFQAFGQSIIGFSNLNLSIPDGQAAGIADFRTMSSPIHQIGSIRVSLDISGDFNGDLYCYVRHGNALAVLLNRPGRTASNPDGYDDSGFQVTLSDGVANGDIHLYQNVLAPLSGSPLTGLWQPDARDVGPTTVLDTDTRTAGLSLFNGADPNGGWTLFAADLVTGGTSVLNGWQLEISEVPEPGSLAMVFVGGALGFALSRKSFNSRF